MIMRIHVLVVHMYAYCLTTVNHGYKSRILVLIFCSYIRFALITVVTTESPHFDLNLLIYMYVVRSIRRRKLGSCIVFYVYVVIIIIIGIIIIISYIMDFFVHVSTLVQTQVGVGSIRALGSVIFFGMVLSALLLVMGCLDVVGVDKVVKVVDKHLDVYFVLF